MCVFCVCVSQLLYIERDYQKKGHLFEKMNWIRMLHIELLDLYVRQKNFHQLKLMTGDKFLIITNEQMNKLLHKESPVKCVPLVLIVAQLLGFTMEAYSPLTLSMHWHWISKMSKKQAPNGWTAIAPTTQLQPPLYAVRAEHNSVYDKKSCQEKVKCCAFSFPFSLKET